MPWGHWDQCLEHGFCLSHRIKSYLLWKTGQVSWRLERTSASDSSIQIAVSNISLGLTGLVYVNTYKGANTGANTPPTARKRNEEAGRLQTSTDVLIILLKCTETSVQESQRERLSKWQRGWEDRIWSDSGGRALRLRLEQISHQYSKHKAMWPSPKHYPHKLIPVGILRGRAGWAHSVKSVDCCAGIIHVEKHRGKVGFWHVSSAGKQQFKPMQGTISGTKRPLYTKMLPLFLSLNIAELFRSKWCLWKCRRTYWLSKLNTNKTGIMSHYLCSGAIMLLFIALTVITVSSDLTATHPLMIYPKQGFIWKRKIPQVLVIS